MIPQRFRDWARQLKAELLALWFSCRHPHTPLAAKIFAALLVAYAFSPIDLIPDFVPVLGYLDDLILLPVGVWLTLKLIPDPVMAECRAQARAWLDDKNPKPRNYAAAAVIILLWLAALWLGWRWFDAWWPAR